jgi:hypothetical protein
MKLPLEEAVVKAQGVVERVHLVVVEHADPVVQLGDVDPERLLEEYAALPAVDLGFWPGKAGPGRGGRGGDGHDRADEVRGGHDDGLAYAWPPPPSGKRDTARPTGPAALLFSVPLLVLPAQNLTWKTCLAHRNPS